MVSTVTLEQEDLCLVLGLCGLSNFCVDVACSPYVSKNMWTANGNTKFQLASRMCFVELVQSCINREGCVRKCMLDIWITIRSKDPLQEQLKP